MYELEALTVLFGDEKIIVYLKHTYLIVQPKCRSLSWAMARPRSLADFHVAVVRLQVTVEHIREAGKGLPPRL